MCLTIPKKIIEKKNSGIYVLEKIDGERQEAKSIISARIGDFVVTQNNIIIQKISKKQAQEINELIKQQ